MRRHTFPEPWAWPVAVLLAAVVALLMIAAAPLPTVARWERHMRAVGLSANTRTVRRKVVMAIAGAAGVDPAQLTADHVESYLAARPLGPSTRRKYLEHVRAWAAFAGLADPTARLHAPRMPRAVPRPVAEDDLAAMLGAARGRERAWLLLGAFAGLRSAETAAVCGADLVTGVTGPMLLVRGKGGRADAIPLPSVLADELAAWRQLMGDGPLWPDTTAATVQRTVARIGRSVGVRVTSHQLRHRYGTALYAESHDLLLVQRLMRHSSPATTAGYALVADSAAADLVTRLPGAGQGSAAASSA